MKGKIILTTIAALVAVSCSAGRISTQAEPKDMHEIFTEAISAVLDSTSSFSTGKAEALLDELADTLQNVMDNSDLNDVNVRLTAQDMAGIAIFAAVDYGFGKGVNIENVVGKFQKVVSTWRTQESEKGFGYLKEIPFAIHKDTEEEEKRAMFIISRTTVRPRTVVMLPQEATDVMWVMFSSRTEGTADYDMDNTEMLKPDQCLTGDNTMDCIFEGTSFMEKMMSHDAAFIFYLDKDGEMETAMVSLGELHRMAGAED